MKAKDADSGDILNKEGTMEYHDARGELSIQFRNMVNCLSVVKEYGKVLVNS